MHRPANNYVTVRCQSWDAYSVFVCQRAFDTEVAEKTEHLPSPICTWAHLLEHRSRGAQAGVTWTHYWDTNNGGQSPFGAGKRKGVYWEARRADQKRHNTAGIEACCINEIADDIVLNGTESDG